MISTQWPLKARLRPFIESSLNVDLVNSMIGSGHVDEVPTDKAGNGNAADHQLVKLVRRFLRRGTVPSKTIKEPSFPCHHASYHHMLMRTSF
jgi:hypothetical protein